MLRKAFTLMEVNLAILIMAGGVLSVVSLFALGYRENRQSREETLVLSYPTSSLFPAISQYKKNQNIYKCTVL